VYALKEVVYALTGVTSGKTVNWDAIGAVGEILGALAVFASLMYLAAQIRGQRKQARASAFQEIGIATAAGWSVLAQNRELSDAVWAAVARKDGYLDLSESDKGIIRAQLLSWIRLGESLYLQTQQELLDEGAMDKLGYGAVTFKNPLVEDAWPDLRQLITPDYAEYLEGRFPNLSQQKQDSL
jgi:hypothetical protein